MHQPHLLVHSLSTVKTLVQPPYGTIRIVGALQPIANVLGIEKQAAALTYSLLGRPVCGV